MKLIGMGMPELFISIVVLSLLAIIPAKIAQKKGYVFWQFYLFGWLLFIPALIVALIIKDKTKVANSSAE